MIRAIVRGFACSPVARAAHGSSQSRLGSEATLLDVITTRPQSGRSISAWSRCTHLIVVSAYNSTAGKYSPVELFETCPVFFVRETCKLRMLEVSDVARQAMLLSIPRFTVAFRRDFPETPMCKCFVIHSSRDLHPHWPWIPSRSACLHSTIIYISVHFPAACPFVMTIRCFSPLHRVCRPPLPEVLTHLSLAWPL